MSAWKRSGGPPSSRSRRAVTVARLPPAESPRDREPRRVGAELGRVAGQPAHRGAHVVGRGRERVLGREPVVDARDDRARRVRQRAAERVERVERADHPAAAVERRRRAAAAPGASAGGRAGSGSRRRDRAPSSSRTSATACPAPLMISVSRSCAARACAIGTRCAGGPGAASIRSTIGWISGSSTPRSLEAAALPRAHDRRVAAVAVGPSGVDRVHDPQRRTGGRPATVAQIASPARTRRARRRRRTGRSRRARGSRRSRASSRACAARPPPRVSLEFVPIVSIVHAEHRLESGPARRS